MSGKQDILGAATITMLSAGDTGHITWKQNKLGCIAISPPLHQTSAHAVTLPPPPAKTPTDTPTSTFDAEGVNLDAETKKILS